MNMPIFGYHPIICHRQGIGIKEYRFSVGE